MANLTGLPSGVSGFLVDDKTEIKTANYTTQILADIGKTFTSVLDGMVFTLAGIGSGSNLTFVNMAEDGAALMTIDPATLDGICYAGSRTDGVTLINPKATHKKGDFVTLATLNGALTSWQVVAIRGIWAKGS